MPRRCSVCSAVELEAINLALVGGQRYRDVALRYALSPWATFRHLKSHMPIVLAHAQKAAEISAGDSLLRQLVQLHEKTLGILSKAEGAGDLRTALWSIREARSNLELLAKLSNQLTEAQSLSITVSTEWISLRSTILRTLEPFPQARLAILEALDDRR